MIREDKELKHYARMGRAALLPGMQHMIDLMQRQVDEMRALLTAQEPRERAAKGRAVADEKLDTGWSSDPEERKAEMRRRFKVREKKKAAQQRAEQRAEKKAAKEKAAESKRAKLSAAATDRWNKMSVRARKARLAALKAGKEKKANVMEIAS